MSDILPILTGLDYTPGQLPMQRKIFWTIAAILNLLTGIWLPLLWSLLSAIPITILSWWIAYRWLDL